MKTIKKSIRNTKPSYKIGCRSSSKSALDELNKTRLAIQTSQDRMIAAMNSDNAAEVAKFKASGDAATAKFAQLIRSIAPVKYDVRTGTYFYAFDKNGKEQFHVLCEITLSKIVEVSANSQEEACAIAQSKIDSGDTIDLEDSPMKTTVISVNA